MLFNRFLPKIFPAFLQRRLFSGLKFGEEGGVISLPPQILINTMPNNIHIAVTHPPGRLLFKISSGTVGLKGTTKTAPKAVYLIIDKLAEQLEKHKISKVRLNFRGVNGARPLLVTQLRKTGVEVTEVMDSTRLPFNGTRPRRSRRI
jgi:ribosomal protein S11